MCSEAGNLLASEKLTTADPWVGLLSSRACDKIPYRGVLVNVTYDGSPCPFRQQFLCHWV
jgi:hypothetical protein